MEYQKISGKISISISENPSKDDFEGIKSVVSGAVRMKIDKLLIYLFPVIQRIKRSSKSSWVQKTSRILSCYLNEEDKISLKIYLAYARKHFMNNLLTLALRIPRLMMPDFQMVLESSISGEIIDIEEAQMPESEDKRTYPVQEKSVPGPIDQLLELLLKSLGAYLHRSKPLKFGRISKCTNQEAVISYFEYLQRFAPVKSFVENTIDQLSTAEFSDEQGLKLDEGIELFEKELKAQRVEQITITTDILNEMGEKHFLLMESKRLEKQARGRVRSQGRSNDFRNQRNGSAKGSLSLPIDSRKTKKIY